MAFVCIFCESQVLSLLPSQIETLRKQYALALGKAKPCAMCKAKPCAITAVLIGEPRSACRECVSRHTNHVHAPERSRLRNTSPHPLHLRGALVVYTPANSFLDTTWA